MLEQIDRASEQELFDKIDPDEMARHLDVFEDLHRESGTDGERKASQYIVNTLEEYGIEARIGEYEGYISIPESATVHINAPRARTFENVTTTAFGANTSPGGVDGELLHIDDVNGDAESLPDLSGKVLYVPELPKPRYAVAATDANAEGILFRSPDEHLHEGIVSPIWGTPNTENADELPDVPVAEVTKSDGDWIETRLAHGGVEITIETTVTTEVTTLPNPVGRIEGTESNRYMVVGNHVDAWFEGVTDNGTAMAATLELARLFADREPRRGIVFGFWSAHSTGRYAGSSTYADRNFPDLRENGVAYLHLDLCGLEGADGLWYQHMAELEAEHFDAMESATDLDIREAEESYLGATGRPARNSDQSFWGAGLSSLLSGARFEPGSEAGGPIGGGWWWHTPEDTRDKVDIDLLVEETKLYTALVSRICESPVLPHDFRATVDDARSLFTEIESEADGAVAFDDEHQRLDELECVLDDVYETLDDVDDEMGVWADAEDLQVRLANTLNPAIYMSGPDSRNEPAAGWERLPHLRSAEHLEEGTKRSQLFAKSGLRKGRARVQHRLDRATRLCQEFLESK